MKFVFYKFNLRNHHHHHHNTISCFMILPYCTWTQMKEFEGKTNISSVEGLSGIPTHSKNVSWTLILIILNFEICVYRTCLKTMVEHFGVYHKEHKAHVETSNCLLLFTFCLLLLSLYLNLLRQNYYKREEHVQQFKCSVEPNFLGLYVFWTCPKKGGWNLNGWALCSSSQRT